MLELPAAIATPPRLNRGRSRKAPDKTHAPDPPIGAFCGGPALSARRVQNGSFCPSGSGGSERAVVQPLPATP